MYSKGNPGLGGLVGLLGSNEFELLLSFLMYPKKVLPDILE
jgi:hypothetical protein